jgi:hypothetical protein
VFVNHLCEAKGEQDGEANKAQESFAEFVILELCGEWYSRSPVRATRNAGFNSLGGGCLSEGGSYHRLCRQ